MNLGFSTDHEALREQLRKLLTRAERRPPADTPWHEPPDAPLWQALAEGG